MAKVFVCDKCDGMEIKAETDDELVSAVRGHMKDTHEIDMSGDDVLMMAQEGQGPKPWWKLW